MRRFSSHRITIRERIHSSHASSFGSPTPGSPGQASEPNSATHKCRIGGAIANKIHVGDTKSCVEIKIARIADIALVIIK